MGGRSHVITFGVFPFKSGTLYCANCPKTSFSPDKSYDWVELEEKVFINLASRNLSLERELRYSADKTFTAKKS